jgi:tetratricopeptide (TPR) repeat protein
MRQGDRYLVDGLRFRKARRWKAAIRAFEMAVERDPASAAGWYWLAVTRDNRGEEASAIPAYRKAIELGLPPDTLARAWTWLASSLSKTSQPKEALACLRESATIEGYRPRAEYRRISGEVERRAARALR